ncbi:hypothetical protein HYPDE_23318 [Hyphomicrobium denitrificans 1NES1]|uniref:Uncharacterized protein n=1 Tax=Hyphomicrobium denitrificans 1NES1 TaxID=670307 RepID=N0B8F8_9HYPH|nr:hypothetical protein [Hyphomicrobium denitrificans]AGK56350.1 hypothetical protein HYPDE_23318 [Hyphomicrobium denitrificans 1NES1]
MTDIASHPLDNIGKDASTSMNKEASEFYENADDFHPYDTIGACEPKASLSLRGRHAFEICVPTADAWTGYVIGVWKLSTPEINRRRPGKRLNISKHR